MIPQLDRLLRIATLTFQRDSAPPSSSTDSGGAGFTSAPAGTPRRSALMRGFAMVGAFLALLAVAPHLALGTTSVGPFQNGSFEDNGGDGSSVATGWTFAGSGSNQVVDYQGATDGSFAVAFNAGDSSSGGVLSQTFATVAGQTYTVRFDFGARNQGFTSLSQLQVEVRDGASTTSGTEIINTGSGQIETTTGGSIVSNTTILQVKDETGAANVNGPAPNSEFSVLTFTFTALSTVSTIVFTDQSTGGGDSQDAMLDNVRIIQAPTATVLATTGTDSKSDSVPGETGANFLSFGPPSVDRGNAGSLVMIQPATGDPLAAIVGGPPATTGTTGAAFAAVGAPQLLGGVLVRAGDPAPDVMDASFAKFGQPVFGGGHYGFLATIAGTGASASTDTGLWSDASGTLALVAREGSPAQDETGADLAGATFSSFLSYVMPDPASYFFGGAPADLGLMFLAKIKGPSVKPGQDLGVWVQQGAQVRLAFRTGNVVTMPDTGDKLPIKGLKLLVASKDIPGQRRSYTPDGTIMALASFARGRQCLIAQNTSSFSGSSFYAIVEDTNVGTLALPTAGFVRDFSMRTKLAIGATMTYRDGKVTSQNDSVILVGSSQHGISVIAQEGDSLRGVPNSRFVNFSEPAMSDFFSVVVFTAKLAGTGINADNNSVLLTEGQSPLTIVARTGDHALGTPTGVLWKSFTSFVIGDGTIYDPWYYTTESGIYFLGKLTGPNVNAMNDTGLWVQDMNGNLFLLARTGDTLNGSGGRTISLISTMNAVADSPGEGRFVDRDLHCVALITFTDHSTALVKFTLPPQF